MSVHKFLELAKKYNIELLYYSAVPEFKEGVLIPFMLMLGEDMQYGGKIIVKETNVFLENTWSFPKEPYIQLKGEQILKKICKKSNMNLISELNKKRNINLLDKIILMLKK